MTEPQVSTRRDELICVDVANLGCLNVNTNKRCDVCRLKFRFVNFECPSGETCSNHTIQTLAAITC